MKMASTRGWMGICVVLVLGWAVNGYADNDGKTVQIKLINHTSKTWTYQGVSLPNPGNTFEVEPTVIPPEGESVITGRITEDFDLFGMMNFNDQTGKQYSFELEDPRYFHATEPEYMYNVNFVSSVSDVIHGLQQARDLSIAFATVQISE